MGGCADRTPPPGRRFRRDTKGYRGVTINGTDLYGKGILGDIGGFSEGVVVVLPEKRKKRHRLQASVWPSKSRLWSKERSFSGKIPLPYKSVPMMAIPLTQGPKDYTRAQSTSMVDKPLLKYHSRRGEGHATPHTTTVA